MEAADVLVAVVVVVEILGFALAVADITGLVLGRRVSLFGALLARKAVRLV